MAEKPPVIWRGPTDGGLLEFLGEHSLDEDYQTAAESGRKSVHPVTTIVTIAAATLLAVVAATQTSRNASTDAAQREALVKQIDQRKANLDAETATLKDLQRQIGSLNASGAASLTGSLRDRLTLLSVRAGTGAVTGPGVRVVVDDAPASASSGDRGRVLDTDLQRLANGLWQAGAEAMAINGERITNLSAIRLAGSAITVNYRSLARPYTIEAIGDPGSLPARFAQTGSGQAWLDLQQQVGLKFSLTTATDISLPAAPVPVLRFALVGQESPQ